MSAAWARLWGWGARGRRPLLGMLALVPVPQAAEGGAADPRHQQVSWASPSLWTTYGAAVVSAGGVAAGASAGASSSLLAPAADEAQRTSAALSQMRSLSTRGASSVQPGAHGASSAHVFGGSGAAAGAGGSAFGPHSVPAWAFGAGGEGREHRWLHPLGPAPRGCTRLSVRRSRRLPCTPSAWDALTAPLCPPPTRRAARLGLPTLRGCRL